MLLASQGCTFPRRKRRVHSSVGCLSAKLGPIQIEYKKLVRSLSEIPLAYQAYNESADPSLGYDYSHVSFSLV